MAGMTRANSLDSNVNNIQSFKPANVVGMIRVDPVHAQTLTVENSEKMMQNLHLTVARPSSVPSTSKAYADEMPDQLLESETHFAFDFNLHGKIIYMDIFYLSINF